MLCFAILQVSELQRLRREEARRTAEIEEALAAVRKDDTIVEGREAALRSELDEVRKQHAERQVSTTIKLLMYVLGQRAVEQEAWR